MWSEIKSAIDIISSLREDYKIVASRLLNVKYGSTIYHPDLTLYSAPAHITSIATGSKDAALSYFMASIVSFVVLNLTEKHFRNMRHPKYLQGFGSQILDRLKANRDVGYAFSAIMWNSPKLYDIESLHDWLDRALHATGLPDFQTIMTDARYDFLHSPDLRVDGDFTERFKYMRSIGMQLLNSRSKDIDPGISDSYISNNNTIPFPSIFDKDDDQFFVSVSRMNPKEYDAEQAFYDKINFYDFSNNFLSSCR